MEFLGHIFHFQNAIHLELQKQAHSAGESHFVPLTICKDKPPKYLNIKMIPGENLTAYLSNLKLGKAIHKGTMRYHITPMNLTKF